MANEMKNPAEGFGSVEVGGCAPPIVASKAPDLDLVQLEALAKAAQKRSPNARREFDAAFNPGFVITLLARVKAAEAEIDRYRDEIEKHIQEKEGAICIANYYDLAREVGADPKMAPFDGVLEKFRKLKAERDAAKAAGIAEGLERAAKICDAYADENIAMCGDSILLDPILHGGEFNKENLSLSDKHQLSSTIHSSMYHAAKNIAAAIRAEIKP